MSPAKSSARGKSHGANTAGLRFALVLSLVFFCCRTQAWAQGCAQCLDSTHATPPQVQAAYRHAIYLLGGVGALLFVVGTLIIRRER